MNQGAPGAHRAAWPYPDMAAGRCPGQCSNGELERGHAHRVAARPPRNHMDSAGAGTVVVRSQANGKVDTAVALRFDSDSSIAAWLDSGAAIPDVLAANGFPAAAPKNAAPERDVDCSDAGRPRHEQGGTEQLPPQQPLPHRASPVNRVCSLPHSFPGACRSIYKFVRTLNYCTCGSSEFGSSVIASLGLSEIASS